MRTESIQISIKGRWVTVPALYVNGKAIVVKGNWLRVASVHDEAWLDTEIEDPEGSVTLLKARDAYTLRADLFTFSQLPCSTAPKYAYAKEWDSIAGIRLHSFNEWWTGLPQESRKNVRRSQKRGVTVRLAAFDDALIKGIADVNNDSPVRQRGPNVHYGKTLEEVKQDQSSFLDRSDFIGAYLGDEMIGFVKVVYRGDVASILSFVPKASHSDKRPANALMAKVVEVCEAKRISYLTYGMFNYGNKKDSPLREFKVRNGFSELQVPRYYIPLTGWGAFCLKTGLHRGLLGILPHEVISLAVKARETWYSIRRPISRCSSMPERPNSNRQTECSNPPAGSNL